MAEKRLLAVFAVLFALFAASVLAQEERSLSLTLAFYMNGSVEASDIWVRYGSPDLRNVAESSDYKIVLKFKDGSLIEQFYEVIFLMAAETEEGPETFQTPYTLLNAEFAYRDNTDKIEVYQDNKLIYQKDLESLCNNDILCNNEETSISCPNDCSKSVKDGWCDPIQDGICDPDCEETADVDCSCGNKVCDSNENPETCQADCSAKEEISTDAPKFFYLIISIVVIAILGIAGFFAYKKLKSRNKNV